MIRSKRQQDTGSLVDLYDRSGEYAKILQPLGQGPLEPDAKVYAVRDELYLKVRASNRWWEGR